MPLKGYGSFTKNTYALGDEKITSTGYTMDTARAAFNGKNPCILYDYGINAFANGIHSPTIYMTSGPDVPGDQTSDTVVIQNNNTIVFPRLGGINGFYADTPTTIDISILSNQITVGTAIDAALGGTTTSDGSNATVPFDNTYTGKIVWNYQYHQAPTAPTNFTVTSQSTAGGGFKFTWTKPSDDGYYNPSITNGSYLTGYRIMNAANNAQYWDVSASATSSTIEIDAGPFTIGQTYSFVIAAKNPVTDQAGTVGPASAVSGSAMAVRLPSIPANFTAVASSTPGSVNTSWSAPTIWEGPTTTTKDYQLYVDGVARTIASTTTSYTVTGLTAGSSHTYQVTARNDVGESAKVGTVSVVTPGPPSAPTGLTATASATTQGRVTLSWTAPSTTAGGITGYNVYRNGTQITNPNGATSSSTTAVIDGNTVGTTYTFTVAARNSWADSNNYPSTLSNQVSVMAPGVPSTPQNVTATPSATVYGQIRVAWTEPATTVGTITFYNIYVDSVLRGTVNGNVLLYDVTGLAYGSHTFTVAARNSWTDANSAVPTGPQSGSVSAVASGAPSAPLNLAALSDTTTAGLIHLTWAAPSNTAGGISKYSIYYSNDTYIGDTANGTITSYDVGGTIPGQVYGFYVVAWNAVGLASTPPVHGAASAVASTTSQGEATSPSNLTITSSPTLPGRLSVSWTAPPGTIVSYNIYRNGALVANIGGTTYRDDFLSSTQTYTYYVTAFNNTGIEGQRSATVSGTPVAVSAVTQPVTSVAAINTTNSVLSGTYTVLPASTANAISYTRVNYDLPPAGVITGTGTITDTTNQILSGSATITVPDVNKIMYSRSGADPVPETDVGGSGSTVVDTTNTAMVGLHTLTAVDTLNQTFTYHPNNTLPADITNRTSAGTVIDTSNIAFNTSDSKITAADNLTFSYAGSGSDVADSAGSGTVTNNTNTDYYNGLFPVAGIVDDKTFTYKIVPDNLADSLTNLATNPSFEASSGTYVLRTNLCLNPSFESGSYTGWSPGTAITAAVSTATAYTGTQSVLLVKNTSTSANAGLSYTVDGLTVGMPHTISAYVNNANGDSHPNISVAGIGSSTASTVPSGVWTRLVYTFTPTLASHTFAIETGTATQALSSFYVDAVLVENSSYSNTYFDGSSSSTDDLAYAWTGTPNASTSTLTVATVANTSSGVDGTSGLLYAKGYRSSTWSNSGTYSLAQVNRGAHNDQWVELKSMVTLAANTTYTFSAIVMTTESIADPHQIRLQIQTSSASSTIQYVYSNIVGPPGVYTFTGSFSTTGRVSGDYVRLYNRVVEPGATIYWDDIMFIAGDYRPSTTGYDPIPAFNGDTSDTKIVTYAWTGTPNASTSTRTSIKSLPAAQEASTVINKPYGDAARTYNPATVEVSYRSGWLG